MYNKKLGPILLILIASIILHGCNSSTPKTTDQPEQQKTVNPTPISVAEVQKKQISYLNVSGTIKANSQIKIFPGASGQITRINIHEGQEVQKNTILFEIGGNNNANHQLLDQEAIAATNLNTATAAYSQTLESNNVALATAKIQLKSAQNQFEANQIDLQTIDTNINSAKNNIDLLGDLMDLTEQKNSDSIDQLNSLIDKLKKAQTSLRSKKSELETSLRQVKSSYRDQSSEKDLQDAIADLTKQISDISTQLDSAKNSVDAAEIGSQMAEDQVQIQINQAKSQKEVLAKTKKSTAKKLGLTKSSSDPLNLAIESVYATKIKNNVGLIQAQAQLTLAKINLQMIQNQVAGLVVKAPITGVVGEITVTQGDAVNLQSPLTQIVSNNNYELKVGINAETSQKIDPSLPAQIELNGELLEIPIKSIGVVADPNSKFVTVTLTLPQDRNFKINQTLKVKFTIVNESTATNTFYIPLDAVIIGTEEQYVYILKNGQAKKRSIKIGEISDNNIQVTSGLKEGDQIIVKGSKNLIDGEEVHIDSPIPR